MHSPFIPFPNYQFLGGPATFMQQLREYLDKNGFAYHTNRWRARDMFFVTKYDRRVIRLAKWKGGKVVQRLDGIYYPQKHREYYSTLNQSTKAIYTQWADFVIFQSEYSKKQVYAMFGTRPENQSTIIYNGVNKQVFFPAKEAPSSQKWVCITTGNFRNIDMLEPIIQAFDFLQKDFPLELHIAGTIHEPLQPLMARPYIRYLGELRLPQVAEALRHGHAYLFSHLNPPCPNAVLEAISTGLPVVGFDSGAMKELCSFSTDLLAPVNNKIFQSYKDFQHNALADKVALCFDNYLHYRKNALAHAHLFNFQDTGRQYLDVFQQVFR